MMFSIIIPVKKINKYVKKNIKIINRINPKKTEILIIANQNEDYSINSKLSLKIIESGPCSPGLKRDMGAKVAKGRYLIFFDDDSFPQKNYFNHLLHLIQTTKYEIFAGPGVTPKKQTIKQRISGAFFLSIIGSGNISRYVPTFKQIVDDWPSVNFVIKKNTFNKIRGFNTNYWPGEDTFLCDKLKTNNKNILYSPELIVFHHRREGLLHHVKQIYQYGFHRGYFVKKYQKTSLKLFYFIPSFFLIFLLIIALFCIYNKYFYYLFLFLLSYLIANIYPVFKILKYEKLYISLRTYPYIIISHLVYGYSFLKGILSFRNLLTDRRYLDRFK